MAVSKEKQPLQQLTDANRPKYLAADVDAFGNDHIIGPDNAKITLLEYGSYASFASAAAHEVVASLHTRFGDQMRYAFRHLPAHDNNTARNAAIVAEYLSLHSIDFWDVHNEFMVQGDDLSNEGINKLVKEEFGIDLSASKNDSRWSEAEKKVANDLETARRSGAFISPTFFINGRRYEGPWDENSLAEAMLETPGHRLRRATVDFVRWGPSSGIALLTMVLLAFILANSPVGEKFEALWQTPFGFQIADGTFELSLLQWINDGLLTLFFLVVGLEIKREFTVGRLSTRRAAMLPLAAATGGIIFPALLYVFVVPSGYLTMGWGTTISTDTAFAIALIVFLGKRVPIELRVFLTASAIVDDLVAILIVAAFYTSEIQLSYLIASAVVTLMLIILNRSGFYRPLPYALLGFVLWFVLHEAGIHATLSGVILALFIPTRPPGNLSALTIQTQLILRTETAFNKNFEHHGPSHRALAMLDEIHDRIESPADKLLRSVEPVSSYIVLPIFALANAGVIISGDTFEGNWQFMLAIILGLVVGKPLGVFVGAWLASFMKIADKPSSYSWRQLLGAGAIQGIGFTMSIFIASLAFNEEDFPAAKVAIFIASFVAAIVGTIILWRQKEVTEL
ncbi:MAG TPA: Na+/H+ antiporter NhaA [Chryseosolibacter sp.]|nr:Na+/H+ antiporter NhaA [Chryseosolibacter sp.]